MIMKVSCCEPKYKVYFLFNQVMKFIEKRQNASKWVHSTKFCFSGISVGKPYEIFKRFSAFFLVGFQTWYKFYVEKGIELEQIK